jgi:hypothetical protein
VIRLADLTRQRTLLDTHLYQTGKGVQFRLRLIESMKLDSLSLHASPALQARPFRGDAVALSANLHASEPPTGDENI